MLNLAASLTLWISNLAALVAVILWSHSHNEINRPERVKMTLTILFVFTGRRRWRRGWRVPRRGLSFHNVRPLPHSAVRSLKGKRLPWPLIFDFFYMGCYTVRFQSISIFDLSLNRQRCAVHVCISKFLWYIFTQIFVQMLQYGGDQKKPVLVIVVLPATYRLNR